MIKGFTDSLFTMTYEFRVFNFDPEPTPLLAFVDSLIGNMSLQTIGFASNGLDKDLTAAICQRLYFNPALTCLDFNGNAFISAEFIEEVEKPYFRQREGFKIILD